MARTLQQIKRSQSSSRRRIDLAKQNLRLIDENKRLRGEVERMEKALIEGMKRASALHDLLQMPVATASALLRRLTTYRGRKS